MINTYMNRMRTAPIERKSFKSADYCAIDVRFCPEIIEKLLTISKLTKMTAQSMHNRTNHMKYDRGVIPWWIV